MKNTAKYALALMHSTACISGYWQILSVELLSNGLVKCPACLINSEYRHSNRLKLRKRTSGTTHLANDARQAHMSRHEDHRQRIPRFVIRRYLEKSIQKKLFCHLQSLQIKTIFQEKSNYKLNFWKFTVAVYLLYAVYDVIGANCK